MVAGRDLRTECRWGSRPFEYNEVGYIVGLARNSVLEREVAVACEVAKCGFEATGRKSVNGGGNMYRGGGAKMHHGLGGSLSP